MIIEFKQTKEDLHPDDAFMAYTHLMDYHSSLLKQQAKCESFYWKYGKRRF